MSEIDVLVHRQLGELHAEMRACREGLARIEVSTANAKSEADASRSAVHRRMDDLVDELGDVKVKVSGMQSDIRDIKPVTDDVRRWKLMGLGALGMTGIAAMALGASFAEAAKRFFAIIIGKV